MDEKQLRNLFDYQRFEHNSRLAQLIAASQLRRKNELSDDDLEVVSAAGDAFLNHTNSLPQFPQN